MSKLGLSHSCLLIACLFQVPSVGIASADVPPCPAVWAASTVPWTGPAGHQDAAVSGTSPSDVWVAGNDGDFAGGPAPMLAHSDGSQWRPASLPVGDPGSVVDVATVSPADVWAGGYLGTHDVADQHALLLHWDGTSVQRVSDPISRSGADASSLSGVAASDSENVWVVGRKTNGGASIPVAERWDGTAWVEHDPVLPAGSDANVTSVATTGPGDVWVVGGRRNEQGGATTLAEHWNGDEWRVVRTPDHAGLLATLTLTGITEVSRGDLWAVGLARYQSSPAGRGSRVAVLVNHWDGSVWTAMTPTRGIRVKYALEPAVAAVGPGDVWISVANVETSPVYRKLPFLHWDGASLRPVTVPVFGSNRFAVPVVTSLGAAGPAELLTGAYGWMCPMVVGDGGFTPPTVSAAALARLKHLRRQHRIYPETASFHVDGAAGGAHEVKDASGLGLFDSGPVAPGASFTYDLTAAGTYPLVDPVTGATGAVEAPVQISPRKGNIAHGFAVGAGQTRNRPDGLHVDMEIREPGMDGFLPWPTGDATSSGSRIRCGRSMASTASERAWPIP